MKKIKICKYCGSTNNLFTSKNGRIFNFCISCKDYHYELINKKRQKTKEERYGNKNYNNSAKRELTNLKVYGYKSSAQSPMVKETARQNNIKNIGIDWFVQTDEFKTKSKKTLLENFGNEKYTNVEKIKQTKEKKYGNKNYNNREKAKDTCEIKYNVSNPNKLKSVTDKTKKSKKNIYWDTFLIKLYNKRLLQLFDKEYYINNNENFKFRCLRCNNEFITDYKNPQRINCGCIKKISKQEFEIEDWLKSLNLNLDIKRNVWITFENKIRREVDILINNKIAIFHHGIKWHSTKYKKNEKFHQQLYQLFTEKRYIPIQIFENEWKLKTNIVKSIILSKLNIYDKIINSNDCKIKEIDNVSYQNFIKNNSIKEYKNVDISLGMLYNDELLSVIGLKNNEIINYCNKLYTNIEDSLNKFIDYMQNNYKFDEIIGFSDLRYDNGTQYLNNEFKLQNIIFPLYYYFKRNYKERYMPKKDIYNDNENNYFKIYDAGRYKFTKSFIFI